MSVIQPGQGVNVGGKGYTNSSQGNGGGATPKKMTLGGADTANYPGSVVSNGNLVVQGDGPIRVFGQVDLNTGGSNPVTAIIRLNGSTTNRAVGATASGIGTVVWEYDASDGDQLELWQTNDGFSSIATGIDVTFLYYTPAPRSVIIPTPALIRAAFF